MLLLERTISIIKPDINEIQLVKKIMGMLEKKGLKIVKIMITKLTIKQAKKFYQEHKKQEFFEEMIKFMCSSPIVVMLLEGNDAIKINREIIGATDPRKAKRGTIRKIYGKSIEKNAIHGSDSLKAAKREIDFFSILLE